jgi:hypothetical protein
MVAKRPPSLTIHPVSSYQLSHQLNDLLFYSLLALRLLMASAVMMAQSESQSEKTLTFAAYILQICPNSTKFQTSSFRILTNLKPGT